ncbi:hypothetical protein BXT86_00975 [candidate division WOR-3 bacterium 4484_100]|uniref:Multidrug ABC transporter substrate-binding protein n=1 Tax=candidate division WOR-3 bacterium 4484_100 TaxID=1936077 RepID=A0A1V4QGI6_UNCW3|nr:MAG: hypothetical protein BXT86_00975 [candidate division WOR-3 bacterium 4484_100]
MHNFLESITVAFQTFRTHKLRSFLTILGVIIGVTTVIAILSLIEGLNQAVAGQIRSLGSDVIYLTKYPMVRRGPANIEKIARRKNFTPQDAVAISKLPSIAAAAPEIERRWDKLKYHDKESGRISIIGSNEYFSKVSNRTVESGRDLNANDVAHRRNVGVLGSKLASDLFGDENPIGKELNIRGKRIRIVGVFQEKGAFLGQSMDNFILVPYSFFEKLFPSKNLTIFEKAFSTYTINIMPKPKRLESAIDEVRELMRRRRGLTFDKKDDFELNTQEMLLDIYRNITQVGFVAIVAIAAISLIVGGIGIMNIMLVSVAERTREIGIRKAVGASNRNILLQFLFESVVLALIGGVIGIIGGILLAKLISAISPLKAAVALWMILLGFGFSAAVGIFFGIYPARRAAGLNPIEALRYE